MHSTCVATYNALITLIIEQPALLDDNENLFKLCEIIELGISGEKAQVIREIQSTKNPKYQFQSGDGALLKSRKQFHPASQRVAEAAEYLMFMLFEHRVNSRVKSCFSSRNPFQAVSDLSKNWIDESTFDENSFKYFALNGNTLLAVTETNNGDFFEFHSFVYLLHLQKCRALLFSVEVYSEKQFGDQIFVRIRSYKRRKFVFSR